MRCATRCWPRLLALSGGRCGGRGDTVLERGKGAWHRAKEQEGCRGWKGLEPVGRREGESSRQRVPGFPRQEGTHRRGRALLTSRVSKEKPLTHSHPVLPRFEGTGVCRERSKVTRRGPRAAVKGERTGRGQGHQGGAEAEPSPVDTDALTDPSDNLTPPRPCKDSCSPATQMPPAPQWTFSGGPGAGPLLFSRLNSQLKCHSESLQFLVLFGFPVWSHFFPVAQRNSRREWGRPPRPASESAGTAAAPAGRSPRQPASHARAPQGRTESSVPPGYPWDVLGICPGGHGTQRSSGPGQEANPPQEAAGVPLPLRALRAQPVCDQEPLWATLYPGLGSPP